MATLNRTAYVAEDPFRLPVRYSVHLDEPSQGGWRLVEQGPEAATVDECVEWGLARAARVVIRMGERFFLAGRRLETDTSEVAAWPPPPLVRDLADRDVEALATRLARDVQPPPLQEAPAGPPPELLPPGPWTATRDHDGTWTIWPFAEGGETLAEP